MGVVQLDKTEKAMILLLQRDGRMSFVDMAKEIGVTEGTVRRKFNRLVGEEIVQIAAVADPFKIGFHTPVLIALKVDPGQWEAVVAGVTALPQVRYAVACTGPYDVVLEAYFATNEELARFLMEELSRVPGVQAVHTSVILKVLKQTFTAGVAGYQPGGAGDDVAPAAASR